MQAPASSPAELLLQAKALWTTQGDREGASAKFEQTIALLTPQAATLDAQGRRILCEAYNWLAVLDDRFPPLKPRVTQHFQAILDLDPDFALDRSVTPARLNTVFETEKNARFPRVEVTALPEGGVLLVDGKPATPGSRRLSIGSHGFAYHKPGYKAAETTLDVQAGNAQPVHFDLSRNASTIAFNVLPIGAEILLDGKVLGRAEGQAGPEARTWAEKNSVPLESLSALFLIEEVLPGKHRLEIRHPCHVTRRIDIGEDFTSPLGDHLLEPKKLESSAAKLSLTSPTKGGEAFLDGTSLGPLPLIQRPICPGAHAITVRFPAGGYSKSVEVKEGGDLNLEARPKPRMAFLGWDSPTEFPGRARMDAQLLGLASSLSEVAYIPPRPGEAAEDARGRIITDREAELILEARTTDRAGVTLVDLRLTTPEGLEERLEAKPLDQDPLAALLRRLNAPLPLSEPSLGILCLDIPGEPGPWVLQASEAALKAGIVLHRPVTAIQGQPVASVEDLRAALAKISGPAVSLTQGAATVSLNLQTSPLELPFQAAKLSYPRAIAELRLRLLGATGPEAGLLRLNLARAYLHFDKPDRALEVLREASLPPGSGISMGNVAYLTGICLLRLGSVYIPEAIQAFNRALQDPGATLFGSEGPLVAPLARAALQSIQP